MLWVALIQVTISRLEKDLILELVPGIQCLVWDPGKHDFMIFNFILQFMTFPNQT